MDLGLDQVTESFEKLAKLPKPYRLAMIPVLVVGMAAGYWHFLYKPTSTKTEAARAQELQLQRKLNEVRSVVANLKQFEQEIEELEAKFTLALRQLPNSKELPVLLTDLSSLGKNAGLEVKVFRPLNEVKKDFYAEVPIEIEFSGRYHDIASFFDEVSRLPRIVNVGRLDFRIASEDSQETFLSVKGQARTFRFLEQADAPAGAAAGKKG